MRYSELYRGFFFLCFVCLSYYQSFGQSAYKSGEILLKLRDKQSIQQVVETVSAKAGTQLSIISLVSTPFRIWHLRFDENAVPMPEMLRVVNAIPQVEIAQRNHIISYRATIPNDPEFSDQWQYINNGGSGGVVDADIDADLAWDITTGGITPDGDTIVVCVVDDGLDISHNDFGTNLWRNHAEIPNNGIDDDVNGYIDDYLGWNSDNNSGNISGGGWHGTPVAGIVGAKGNNGIGVTGVSWDVKVMVVVGGGDEASAVEAYTYPYVMRKLYNQSGGAEGAFVVATNSSWGIDFGQPADAPLWCAFYDSLGVIGVVSCGATINDNVNVDVDGDLPTGCTSNYLISVTNMWRDDQKVSFAGYGVQSVDIGAFGQDTWTTALGGGYEGFGGTSGATPHVAGAVGLLYAAPCQGLALLSKTDPAAAALAVIQSIFDGADQNASLQGITKTGGRLNLYQSLLELENNVACTTTGCPVPYAITLSQASENSLSFSWTHPGENNIDYKIAFNKLNTSIWDTLTATGNPFTLSSLLPCTEYNIAILADCDTAVSGFSSPKVFKTDGCCEPPLSLSVNDIRPDKAWVVWQSAAAANSYRLQYKLLNAPPTDWYDVTGITSTSFEIFGLSACSSYQLQIASLCDTGYSAFSPLLNFRTVGCLSCDQTEYCPVGGGSTQDEWIETVLIDTLESISGNNNGYAKFFSDNLTLEADSSYWISVTPGFSAQPYDEYIKAWIDYNQDGIFKEPEEIIFDSEGLVQSTASGEFTIPDDVTPGVTRLRVIMEYDGNPTPCDDQILYGEVEDYCVNILKKDPVIAIQPVPEISISISPNPVRESFLIRFSQPLSAPFTLSITDATGKAYADFLLSEGIQQIELNHLADAPAGVYFLRGNSSAFIQTFRLFKQ